MSDKEAIKKEIESMLNWARLHGRKTNRRQREALRNVRIIKATHLKAA